jgi:hypothetical protein
MKKIFLIISVLISVGSFAQKNYKIELDSAKWQTFRNIERLGLFAGRNSSEIVLAYYQHLIPVNKEQPKK